MDRVSFVGNVVEMVTTITNMFREEDYDKLTNILFTNPDIFQQILDHPAAPIYEFCYGKPTKEREVFMKLLCEKVDFKKYIGKVKRFYNFSTKKRTYSEMITNTIIRNKRVLKEGYEVDDIFYDHVQNIAKAINHQL